MMFLALLAALQVAAPVKPAKPLDSKDARSVAEHAIYATRTQQRYETAFKIHKNVGGTDIDYEGTSLTVGQGILIERYLVTGGREVSAVRAGKVVWIWVEAGKESQWVSTDESGDSDIARGEQNPEEVLAILAANLNETAFDAKGVPELRLTGKALAAVLRANPALDGVDPEKSRLAVRFDLDKSGRLDKLTMSGELERTVEGKVLKASYAADVRMTSYNGKGAIQVTDAKGKPLPLNDPIEESLRLLGLKVN